MASPLASGFQAENVESCRLTVNGTIHTEKRQKNNRQTNKKQANSGRMEKGVKHLAEEIKGNGTW